MLHWVVREGLVYAVTFSVGSEGQSGRGQVEYERNEE